PAAAPDPVAEAPAADLGTAATGRRILIVEDNADARITLAALLTLLGHRVETASSGIEGIEQALDGRPEVALIDLGLPGMDGCEVARQLRSALGDSIHLVALTGYALDEDRDRTRAAGFDAHLVKPVETEDLNRVLARDPPGNPETSGP